MNTACKLENGRAFDRAYLSFSHTLSQLVEPNSKKNIAFAVSGGADSMCQSLLLHQWAHEHNVRIIALTVDHLLRPESTAEADQVGKWMNDLGIEHHILSWQKNKYPKNLQEAARSARYELLVQWCQENNVPYLALAHNQDDQLETMIQRLAHQSGPFGLAGIPDLRQTGSVSLIRPMLNFSRPEIIQVLNDRQQPWIEDPSNQNLAYTRIKIRKSTFVQDDICRGRLLHLRNRMARHRLQTEAAAKEFCDHHLTSFPEGYCLIETEALQKLDRDTLECVLATVMKFISGKKYPVGNQKLARILDNLFSGQKLSCHGCLLQTQKGATLICREANNIDNQIQPVATDQVLWDNRFLVTLTQKDLEVKCIGKLWLSFRDSEQMMSLPLAVRPSLPGIWQKETLLIVPHLAYDSSLKIVSMAKPLFCSTLQFCRSRFIFN